MQTVPSWLLPFWCCPNSSREVCRQLVRAVDERNRLATLIHDSTHVLPTAKSSNGLFRPAKKAATVRSRVASDVRRQF